MPGVSLQWLGMERALGIDRWTHHRSFLSEPMGYR